MNAHYDLLIRNAKIVDGARRPRYAGDIGVRDGRIADIGRLDQARGIASVIVNGVPVWQEGQSTGARPGRVLRAGAA